MKPIDYTYLFGPVPSRRLGRSLGIDLTPHKTCSLNCVFCQLGRTPKTTVNRKAYVPIDAVIAELSDWLKREITADYLTLSGSGEPTLHSQFGDVLSFLRNKPIPSVLLTNGTLFHWQDVREDACLAKVVKVSLSAWDQNSFEWVNRPHPKLQFEHVVEGIRKFRERFKGKFWLEVFLLSGINSMPAHVEKISRLSKQLRPDHVHLNTIARPPAEDYAAAVPRKKLEQLAEFFDPPAHIADGFSTTHSQKVEANKVRMLSMLRRRPCTVKQIEDAFGIHINEVAKTLGYLMKNNQICAVLRNQEVYFRSKR